MARKRVKLIADAPTLFVVEQPTDEYYAEVDESQQPTSVLRNGRQHDS